jgi:hypothetical protein
MVGSVCHWRTIAESCNRKKNFSSEIQTSLSAGRKLRRLLRAVFVRTTGSLTAAPTVGRLQWPMPRCWRELRSLPNEFEVEYAYWKLFGVVTVEM